MSRAKSRGNPSKAVPDHGFPSVPSRNSEILEVPDGSQSVPVVDSLVPSPRVRNREPRKTAHARAARREREAAELLGTQRIHRGRYESAPDVAPVTLPCGLVLQAEVKTRRRMPALIAKAIEQARRYAPSAVPAVVLSETGGEALLVLPLRSFRTIAGVHPWGPAVNHATPPAAPGESVAADDPVTGHIRNAYAILDDAADREEIRAIPTGELLKRCISIASAVAQNDRKG